MRSKNYRRRTLCVIVALILVLPFSAPVASGQESVADGDVLLKAMADELARSVAQLNLKEVEKPYFIEYTVEDEDALYVRGVFGALANSTWSRSRVFNAQVRVGNYDFDNTGFVSASEFSSANGTTAALVVENDYMALRHDMWLATDAAYKHAVEQFAGKRAFLQNKVEEEKAPDFSREPPLTVIAPRLTPQLDKGRWEKAVREWSSIFKQFPLIQDSDVSLSVRFGLRYLANSEGARIRQPYTLVSLVADATTQAADGMQLSHSVPIYAKSLENLPSSDEFSGAVRRMAEDLTKLHAAPSLDKKYVGPVLFTGQSSAELFSQILAPHLSGERSPLAENEYSESQQSALADRLNRPVLPTFISVFDNPTQQDVSKQPLIGAYQIDNQGVQVKRLSLIEDGVLKGLLMSRRPRKEMLKSTGHGRETGAANVQAQIGNLFVQSKDGKSQESLKQELIKLCRAQNLPYGILIRNIYTDPRPDGLSLSAPSFAYKVYVDDGREELIRGITFEDISVRALKQIIAAGDQVFVHNLILGSPSSVIAPAVLLEEVGLNKFTGAQQKPVLLSHPYFSK